MPVPYRIRPESNGFRASIARPRGAGAVRRWFPDFPTAEAWALANVAAVRASTDVLPPSPAEIAEYRAAKSILPAGQSLIDAARAYSARTASSDPTVAEAVAAYHAAKTAANLRPASLENIRICLAHLPPALRLSAIRAEDLDSMLALRPPHSRNQMLVHFVAFFRWCIARGMLAANPADGLERARIDFKPPAVYSPAQASIVFVVAETAAPHLCAYLALAAFAGIRTEGLRRLGLDAIDHEHRLVVVSGAADKLRNSYMVAMRDNLICWLDAYPWRGLKITRRPLWVALNAIFREAGVVPIKNGWRHSFGTYLTALTDPRHAAVQLGHLGGGVETLLSHYRRLATPESAREYFGILPKLAKPKQASTQP
jgi:site-specific recombinase XerD